ncbi:unnamed protein product [Paramecium octaurelia]|uniref:Uncharacterized protein n=1 Tax=Paramecium octaurelia TaxID=43137 RepID=A0A8S1UFX4_PAROT|nr:unnamed protein product [Paramecium octaurelia]
MLFECKRIDDSFACTLLRLKQMENFKSEYIYRIPKQSLVLNYLQVYSFSFGIGLII